MLLEFKLFGTPTVSQVGEPLQGFISVKSRALLIYLVMKPGVHSRKTLATLLWPESSESVAAKNLRNVLSNLRKLVQSHVDITRRTASFRRDAPYFLDVEAFSALLERYRRSDEDIVILEEAVSLYSGDFVEGFHVSDSESFEAWLTLEREQLRLAQLETLRALALWYTERSNFNRGMDYVSRLLTMNNFSETGQRLKMTLLAQNGRRVEALAAYSEFRALLNEELGVEPMIETMRLFEEIRDGTIVTEPARGVPPANLSLLPAQRIDWGDIPTEAPFYGRRDQLRKLQRWLTDSASRNAGPRFIFITGMGGVGKTTLAARLMRTLAQAPQTYDFIIWRSLINAPPLTVVLRACLATLSRQQLIEVPETDEEQISLLLSYLRERRCLLILDNFESVLEPDVPTGSYRPGYEGYGRLIQRVGGGQHQSSLLITSRELPQGLSRISQSPSYPAVLKLSGLPGETGINLLRVQGIAGSGEKLAEVVKRYSGNPLALKLVAGTAKQLFAGDVDKLLQEAAVFGDIYELLDNQFSRLTPLEYEILTWLAIEHEPLFSQTIWDDLATKPHKRHFLEALQSLYYRSLLEQASWVEKSHSTDDPRYTLQNVVLEFAVSRLIESICSELEADTFDLLQRFALVKAHTKEYIQVSQRRLHLEPVAQWLKNRFGKAGAVQKLLHLLKTVQAAPAPLPGYAGANTLHLLTALGADLNGRDFSNLSIWQADLREATLSDVSCRGSDLRGTIFRGTFGLALAVAFSPDGQFLAAATSDGSITLWRPNEYQPFLVVRRSSGYDLTIAFNSDGKILAGAGIGGVIYLWRVATGEQFDQFLPPANEVSSLVFSPDGKTLYSSDDERRISAWDMDSRQLLWQIDTAEHVILSLAVSRDGTLLAGGGLGGTLTLWQAQSGKVLRHLEGCRAKIHSIAFSPDDVLLAAAVEDNTIHLWHVHNGEEAGPLSGHNNFVLTVAFQPEGALLASGSADRTIRLWNYRQRRLVRVIHGSANWVKCVAFSPDGQLLASGGYDRKIHLLQSNNGQLLRTLRGWLKTVNVVLFSPDGRLLASAYYDRPVQLWDVQNGRLLHTFKGHKGSMRQLAFSPDGRLLAVSGDETSVRLWDTQSGQLRRTLSVEKNFVRTLAFSPDGVLLAAGMGTGTGALVIWDTATGQSRFTVPDVRTGLDFHFSFSSNSRFLAFSDRDHVVKLLDVQDGTICCTLFDHQSSVEAIRFSRDGSLMASLDRDGNLFVWRMAEDRTLQLQAQFQGDGANEDLWNLVFSPNSQIIAFQLDGSRVGLFDVSEGRLVRSVDESLYGVGNVAFSSDSELLITGSADGNINLWTVHTGQHHQALVGHEGTVMAMDVNPAGSHLASGDDEGTIRIWDIQAGVCNLILTQPRPYEGLDISSAEGLSEAQLAALKALGARAEL